MSKKPIDQPQETAFCISDIHIPYESRRVIDKVLRCMEDRQPEKLFILGDTLDAWTLSKFDKEPHNPQERFEEELEKAKDLLLEIRGVIPNADITMLEGNHERRLRKRLMKDCPELYGIVNFEKLLELAELEIDWVDGKQDTVHQYRSTLLGHFNKVSKYSCYTAKALVEERNMNIVQSHTHRAGHFMKSTPKGVLHGLESGCLCKLKPPYLNNPNWQQAFVVIRVNDQGQQFFELVPVVNKKFFFEGKEYK